MNVTFFITFNGYQLLYTHSRLPTQPSYTNIHLNFTLYYHIYCILQVFTLCENLRKCICLCLHWRVPCIIPLCEKSFSPVQQRIYTFASMYPWVQIRYDFRSESIPMGIMSRGGICLPVTPARLILMLRSVFPHEIYYVSRLCLWLGEFSSCKLKSCYPLQLEHDLILTSTSPSLFLICQIWYQHFEKGKFNVTSKSL